MQKDCLFRVQSLHSFGDFVGAETRVLEQSRDCDYTIARDFCPQSEIDIVRCGGATREEIAMGG